MLITASIANPARFDYEDYTEAYTKKMESINLVIGSEDVLNEYENQIGQELYDYIKVKGYEYMYFIIFTVLYFAVFACNLNPEIGSSAIFVESLYALNFADFDIIWDKRFPFVVSTKSIPETSPFLGIITYLSA